MSALCDLAAIKTFAEESIDPVLASHGGSLEIVDYDPADRTVKVRYNGACAGCPSSYAYTHNTILALLQSEFHDGVAELERV
jgi:Fe-S cluster biogenesis protein NfuA